ncbi:TPA: hypothetical protein DCZ36_00800 [Candidatus Gracilibacteria bacterium]|nr:hypothetical protein [Candidatus Gracilibacteria bacterium]
MKFLFSLFLTGFFVGSIFLPLIHLVEISHAQESGNASVGTVEVETGDHEKVSSDTSGCEKYVLSFHSERLPVFPKDLEKIPTLLERECFSQDLAYENTIILFFSGNTDPPPFIPSLYPSLIGIIKNQT